MKAFVSVEEQIDLNNFVQNVDWEDAFIREAYVVSPSYIRKHGGLVAAYLPPDINMIIILSNDEKLGIEIKFHNVIRLCINTNQPLSLSGSVIKHNANVELHLCESYSIREPDIVAEKMLYRFLDNEAIGHSLHYGFEDVFDTGGVRI